MLTDPATRARAVLVDGLLAAGCIRSPAVEEALRAVPRHLFLPGTTLSTAYADDAVAIQHVDGAATSSASQPSMVAIMLEQLDLRPGQRVLEVGAGTGWNAALIARIVGAGGAVTSIDIDDALVGAARVHLAGAGVEGVRLICGDGALGVPDGAPYDRIVLTVGSGDVWPEWVAQLAPGGRLLLPLAVRGTQLSVALDLGDDGVLRSASVRSCGFIRLRGMGAATDPAVRLPGGAVLLVPADADTGLDPGCTRVFGDPGVPRDCPVRLGPADVWDGFGLWLTLTEPGAARVLARRGGTLPGARPDGVAALRTAPLPVTTPSPATPASATPASATPASATPAPATRPPATAPSSGSAMLLGSTSGQPVGAALLDVPDERGPVVVHPFGPAGSVLAARMLAALDAWTAAGAPTASTWRVTVLPTAIATPDPLPEHTTLVRKHHCTLLLTPTP